MKLYQTLRYFSISVDALSNANNSRPKSADSEFERLKDFEKTTITTNTTSNFNNLLIPVSSLPLNIIAELPESVRMSFTTAVTAATTASLTLSSEKGVNVFDETSPKKEILEGGDTLFSLDKYGQLRNGGKNGMKSNGKREGKDFTEEETEEIEVEVDCGRSDHGRLSSDEDNSNEEDLEDEEEYEEDGSGVRKKKTRTVFSRTQVGQLETMFDLKRYLSSSERSTLARDLGLSEQQIKIWFQNRRNKLKRQIKTGMEMAGSISAGTVPPPNVNAALLNSHSLYMGSMAGGASLPGAPHHHHHPHPHPSFHLGSGFSTMSPLFSTPGGHNSSTSNVGVAPNPAGTGVSLTGGPLGSASLMSNMLPGMNFHQHSGNPGIATSFQQQLNNPFFRSPLTSSFGSTTANSLLSPPGSANQNASLFSTNQNISISPFSSSTPTISANQPNASQANFSYPNLQLFKSLSGLV